MEKAEVNQTLIFVSSEITLLIFSLMKITRFEICIFFHQYHPVFH